MRFADGSLVENGPIGLKVPEPSSFGEDGLGKIYITSLADGTVYRLDPSP
jgi:hypothetical protein